MRLDIEFETGRSYDPPVRYVAQYLRLTPRDTARQRVLEWQLEMPGQPLRIDDRYGNVLHVLTLDEQVAEVRVRATGTVETARNSDEPSDFSGTALSPLLFLRETVPTSADDEMRALATSHRASAIRAAGLRELAAATRTLRQVDGIDAMIDTFIGVCRLLRVPCRYVSGLVQAADGARTSLHAWAEAWVLDRWRSIEVAKDGEVGERHVKLAFGADSLEARPIRAWPLGGLLDTEGAATPPPRQTQTQSQGAASGGAAGDA